MFLWISGFIRRVTVCQLLPIGRITFCIIVCPLLLLPFLVASLTLTSTARVIFKYYRFVACRCNYVQCDWLGCFGDTFALPRGDDGVCIALPHASVHLHVERSVVVVWGVHRHWNFPRLTVGSDCCACCKKNHTVR